MKDELYEAKSKFHKRFCLCDILSIDLREINIHNIQKCRTCNHEVYQDYNAFTERVKARLRFIQELSLLK
jgi:hypothetical protein